MDSPVVYLARHGTPEWNVPGLRYDIPPGPPLVAQGEEEAAKLGEFLKSSGVRKVYASPLVRALRTAEIAAAVAGLPVEVVDAAAEYRREEDDAAVFARFNPFFLRAWGEAAAAGPIAIVSHGGPVRVMLERLGVLPDAIWHYRRQFDHQNPLPPAGAWRISNDGPPGAWQLELQFAPQEVVPYLPVTVAV
jgi:broad specificity phosphatase PhoE